MLLHTSTLWIPNDFADEKKSAEDMNMSDVLIQSGRVNLSNRDKELGEEIKLDENFDINATKTEEDYKRNCWTTFHLLMMRE